MSYVIAGRAIKNEYLALGTIFTTAAIALTQSGGSSEKKEVASGAPVSEQKIEAGSSEEEDFIKQFVAEAEKDEKKH